MTYALDFLAKVVTHQEVSTLVLNLEHLFEEL